jgi:hypothetical protein
MVLESTHSAQQSVDQSVECVLTAHHWGHLAAIEASGSRTARGCALRLRRRRERPFAGAH